MKPEWHIVTGEYPPSPGGVADYTQQVAQGLRRIGEQVHVWAPVPCSSPTLQEEGVTLHWLADGFGPGGLLELFRGLRRTSRPKRILLQYVPQAFGWRGLNGGLVASLSLLSREIPLWTLFHEVSLDLLPDRPLRWKVIARGQRELARALLRVSEEIFVSTESWIPLLQNLHPKGRTASVLPIPSNLPTETSETGVAQRRAELRQQGPSWIGHFGTYSSVITDLLFPAITQVAEQRPDVKFLLLGRGAVQAGASLSASHPSLEGRLLALGEQPRESCVEWLAACDLLLQPFPDGVTTRRTSVMAGLALGRPVVTNLGALSETFWSASQAVRHAGLPSAPALAREACELLDSASQRASLGDQARRFYLERLSLENTLATLHELSDSHIRAHG